MQTGFILLTDAAEALNGKLYALGAGWNMLRLAELPGEHRFGIAVGVDVDWDNTNRRHGLLLQVEDPDGDIVGDPFAMEFETGRPPGTVPGQDQRIVLALSTDMTFTAAGPHAVVVLVGGTEIGRTRFYVVAIPVPGGMPPGP